MRRFECPYCKECPTVEEWNSYNKLVFITFGYTPLPNAYDEEDSSSSFDCPGCEERVVATDLTEV